MTFTVPDDISARIEAMAQEQQRDPVDVLRVMLQNYEATLSDDPLEKIVGIFDDDITDLSEDTSFRNCRWNN